MTDRHLGERLHDLLDGRLSREDSHAAMAHLDTCDECTARWSELRTAREALHSSEAGIDMTFARMLLDRERMAEIAKGESKHRARAARGRDRRPATIAVAVVVLLGLTMGSAYVAGAPEAVSPEFAAVSASGTGESLHVIPPGAMETSAQMNAWVRPDWQEYGLIPLEARIESHHGSTVLVASLIADGDIVVVTQQRGRLVDDVVSAAPRITVNDVDAYVANTEPVIVVWQAGRVVIAAACDCSVDTLVSVIAAFPAPDDPGVVDRIATGLGEFKDALTGR